MRARRQAGARPRRTRGSEGRTECAARQCNGCVVHDWKIALRSRFALRPSGSPSSPRATGLSSRVGFARPRFSYARCRVELALEHSRAARRPILGRARPSPLRLCAAGRVATPLFGWSPGNHGRVQGERRCGSGDVPAPDRIITTRRQAASSTPMPRPRSLGNAAARIEPSEGPKADIARSRASAGVLLRWRARSSWMRGSQGRVARRYIGSRRDLGETEEQRSTRGGVPSRTFFEAADHKCLGRGSAWKRFGSRSVERLRDRSANGRRPTASTKTCAVCTHGKRVREASPLRALRPSGSLVARVLGPAARR
jgi:hypothetical protein